MVDLVVIGAGPGGYVAAIRAAKNGFNVVVVEKDAPGGVCLNWGCIPSKNLIHQADQFASLSDMAAVGVQIDRSSLNYSAVQAKSRDVVNTLTRGVAGLLKHAGVDYRTGVAEITGAHQVCIDGTEYIDTRFILVATGSRPMEVSGFEFDEQRVLSSTGALSLVELPASLLILGGGAIGCEFAFVMANFGVDVTLVEAADHLLPQEDFDVCEVLEQSLSALGVNVLTNTRALALQRASDAITVTLESGSGVSTDVRADKALVVFGRSPNTSALGLATVGIVTDPRGFIPVDAVGATCVPSIYAIGDITASPALAHVASAEGERAVDHMAGLLTQVEPIDPSLIPSAIYTEPQVAGFGLRETSVGEAGTEVMRSVFPYHGAGKSIAVGKSKGLVKLLVDQHSGELLGAHVVGHNATELIHELLLMRSAELLPEDIEKMIHAHPTLSETLVEAVRGLSGRAIHA